VPVDEIVDALNAHVRAGRIREFGGSNWTPERLDAANAYAAARGLKGFALSSPNFSLAVPKETIWDGCISANDPASRAWYTRTQMPLFAWSSQARGFFSGLVTPENVAESEFMSRVYDSPENWERLRRARALGERRGFSAIQAALAWTLRQPFPVFSLVGPCSLEELRSCLGALELELSEEDVRWLNLE
jgi:1-deoxyxylulose-5-phosphate synthase